MNVLILFLLCVVYVYSYPISAWALQIRNGRRRISISATTLDNDIVSSPSVWTTFAQIAEETKAINLGQGFPDWDPPAFVTDALLSIAKSSFHQYSRPSGILPLVDLIGQRYSRHLQRSINSVDEIAITVGATQALFLALTTILRPNDEIVVFEPFFDLYSKQIKLTGAIPRYVSLGGPTATTNDPWALDIESLKRSITSKTRILLLNSPHNPTGKVSQNQIM